MIRSAASERVVAGWLERYMFAGRPDAARLAAAGAKHFNDAATHKSHGRRIDRDEARAQQIVVDDLETSQPLQEAVLTLYHLMCIVYEKGPAVKLFHSDSDRMYVKNWAQPQLQIQGLPNRTIAYFVSFSNAFLILWNALFSRKST